MYTVDSGRLTTLYYLRYIPTFLSGGVSFWVGRESKKLKWRTLTGPEKLIL